MPVLRRDNDGVAVHCMKWGLVPGFTKKTDKPDFFKMFNARSESVAEKASFRRLLPKNRCLVAVDGFYEWKKEGSKKQPYYIHFKDERPLVFAALFDSWQNSGGETLYTFTILTTASSSALDWLHDRMPVILGDKDSVDTWLDDPSTSKLQPLLAPYEKSDLVWYPVTSAIGKLSFDGPECIQQIPLKASQNSLISKFFSAKQPKTEEKDKETRSTDATILAGPKEEPLLEGYEGVVVSDSNDESKQVEEENEAQKIVKAEGDRSAGITSDRESVKKEIEEGEGESVETGGGLEFTGGESSVKSGTKRGYELFSGQENPWKQSVVRRLQDVDKSSGKKQGKGKSNTKKSKEKETQQSTLHFFFDEK